MNQLLSNIYLHFVNSIWQFIYNISRSCFEIRIEWAIHTWIINAKRYRKCNSKINIVKGLYVARKYRKYDKMIIYCYVLNTPIPALYMSKSCNVPPRQIPVALIYLRCGLLIADNYWEYNRIYVSRCNATIRGAIRTITCLLKCWLVNSGNLWCATSHKAFMYQAVHRRNIQRIL